MAPLGEISIHAARVGCDIKFTIPGRLPGIFQSTQPEWAATKRRGRNSYGQKQFQSTQPEWAATIPYANAGQIKRNFNPRSPSGLRPARIAF